MTHRGVSERRLLVMVFALILAPVIAQAIWRPLLGPDGDASAALWVSFAALTSGALGVAASWRSRPLAVALPGLVALGTALLLGGAAALAVLLAGTALALLAPARVAKAPEALDGRLASKTAAVAWLLLSAVVTVKAALLSTFMADPSRVAFSLFPGEPFLFHHSCLTSGLHALGLFSAGAANLYDPGAVVSPGYPLATAAYYAPFSVDDFNYPPPFLLVPMALAQLVDGFLAQRALWYGVNGVAVAVGLWALGVFVGGRRGAIALLLSPLAWLAWSYALQIGNVQGLVAVGAIGAMVCFERRKVGAGAVLLAAATLFKIGPGLLGVSLLVQRRWREAGWTLVVAALIAALGLIVLGTEPYRAYVSWLLPRLVSGEALSNLARDAKSITLNFSAFSLPFKLGLLGLEMDRWAVARGIAAVYTVLVFVLAVLGSLRRGDRGDQAMVWLAVFSLAALRVPYAPPFYLGSVVWLLTLLAGEVRTLRGVVALVAIAVGLLAPAVPRVAATMAIVGLLSQTTLFGLLTYVVLRRPVEYEPSPDGPSLPARPGKAA